MSSTLNEQIKNYLQNIRDTYGTDILGQLLLRGDLTNLNLTNLFEENSDPYILFCSSLKGSIINALNTHQFEHKVDDFSHKDFITWNWEGSIWGNNRINNEKVFHLDIPELEELLDFYHLDTWYAYWKKHRDATLLNFNLGFKENVAIISFYTRNEWKIDKGDTISLLFDNGQILDFKSNAKPVKQNYVISIPDAEKHNKYHKLKQVETSFSAPLYQEDLNILFNNNIESFRITFAKEDKNPIAQKFDNSGLFGYIQEAIHCYVKEFLRIIKQEFPHYEFPTRNIQIVQQSYNFPGCYVYLMRDTTNGYFKIGISNKPEYREKTLQSEKPTIELLAYKKYPTRKIAEAIESALHTAYGQQRIRGEWFSLDGTDAAVIIETLK